MHLPRGFIPVMLTPFHDDGTVDFDTLTRLTEYYLDAGAAGLFATCLSGEMYELTPPERLAVTRHVVQMAAGRVPVVATGTFGGTLPQQADFVKQTYETGVQAVIVISSLLAEPDEPDEVWLENAHELLHRTEGVPLGFYECPLPYKRLLSPHQLGQLVATGRVVYHKDTSLDLAQVRAKLAAGQGHNFGLYDAYLVHAVDSLRAGSAGLSCIQGNFFPELIVWLCRYFDDPARGEAVEAVQEFFTKNMDLMHTAYPTIAKYALRQRGFPISLKTRRDVEPLTPGLRRRTDELLADYAGMEAEWLTLN
ncbi:MAG: dihydrodipicolinate synthase family protein [Cytophagaceae bacterium]|nr:dihydrodipicolinate synthase family protein [Cytophagaceae bacterium]